MKNKHARPKPGILAYSLQSIKSKAGYNNQIGNNINESEKR